MEKHNKSTKQKKVKKHDQGDNKISSIVNEFTKKNDYNSFFFAYRNSGEKNLIQVGSHAEYRKFIFDIRNSQINQSITIVCKIDIQTQKTAKSKTRKKNEKSTLVSILTKKFSNSNINYEVGNYEVKQKEETKYKINKLGYNYADKFNPNSDLRKWNSVSLTRKKDLIIYLSAEAARFKHTQKLVEELLFQANVNNYFEPELIISGKLFAGTFYKNYGLLKDFLNDPYTKSSIIAKLICFGSSSDLLSTEIIHINFNLLIEVIFLKEDRILKELAASKFRKDKEHLKVLKTEKKEFISEIKRKIVVKHYKEFITLTDNFITVELHTSLKNNKKIINQIEFRKSIKKTKSNHPNQLH